ncbi:threonine--tRNA ligase [Candidatus Woesearchaeota archaeon]|nr:threonine--tRNA ligase [Candidatus Woesearchaeota archaeon]
MKILTIHADYLKYKALKKALKNAEELEKKDGQSKDCLVVFTAVEKPDEKNIKNVVVNYVNEIKLIAKQVNAKNIVLYPYAHLSQNLSSPNTALEVLKEADKQLREEYNVLRAPFGYYKSFELSCKGHPLSELSREILADSKEIQKADKPLDIKINKLSNIEKLRNTFNLILSSAVLSLFPNVKPAYGYLDEEKFFYDFEKPNPFTQDDLKRIENKMGEIIKKSSSISEIKSKNIFENNLYKKDLLKDIKKTSAYEINGHKDLLVNEISRQVPKNNPFKLLTVAGVYWKGSSANKQLQRIYGVAFENKKQLDKYLKDAEEAEKRDHRTLGKSLNLFTFSDYVGKGLPLWLPKGTIIKDEIEKFAVETENNYSYLRVSTPHLAKKELYERSGHLPYYENTMYPAMMLDDGVYYLKAMNCPHHHLIYNSSVRSYKELPLRLAEYGAVYRNELSGTLAGLLRVRILSMNDAHIYCTKDQIEDELKNTILMIKNYYNIFGFKDYWVRLSLYDPQNKAKYIDEPEKWEYTQDILRKILKKLKIKFVEKKDEAAFYGPKIDVQLKTVAGREETISTVQLDFAAKDRFDLKYFDKNNKESSEVYVIHRAPLSTHERFIAFLLENTAGKLPLWLSPVQVSVITVTDRNIKFAKEIYEKLKENNIRAELNDHAETLGKKVLESQKQKINYLITIGDKEDKSRTLAVRTRDGKIKFNVKVDNFINLLKNEISERSLNSKL